MEKQVLNLNEALAGALGAEEAPATPGMRSYSQEELAGMSPEHKVLQAGVTGLKFVMRETVSVRVLSQQLEASADPLERYALLRRMQKELESAAKVLLGPANRAFASEGGVELERGECRFKAYSKPPVYDYPAEVVKEEERLKAQKKLAVAEGTAKARPYTPDPDVDTMFTVKIVGPGA